MATTKRVSFEELYGELEAKVARLEQGGLSLDDSLAAYEDAVGLAKRCQELLDKAELRITKLRAAFADNGAGLDEAPYDDEEVE
jgi:exodeoxyribonuclease VII small subunit